MELDHGFAVALHIAAHFTVNDGLGADDLAAAQIPFGTDVHRTPCLDIAAETAADLVVLKVNVSTTRAAGAGVSRAAHFLTRRAFKTLHHADAWFAKDSFDFLEKTASLAARLRTLNSRRLGRALA